jgi:hypothetical protein
VKTVVTYIGIVLSAAAAGLASVDLLQHANDPLADIALLLGGAGLAVGLYNATFATDN